MDKHKNIKSTLSDIPKENPFDVPFGYFETLQSRVEARITADEEQLTKKQQIIRTLKPIVTLAASFAIAFLLLYYPISKFIPSLLEANDISVMENTSTEVDFMATFVDDQTLFEALNETDESTSLANEEVLAYLSVEMSDFEVYNELSKN